MLTLNFDDCPSDALEALVWLSGAQEQVDKELDARWQQAYYEARLTGRIEAALALGYHSQKRVLAWTRAVNNRTGRFLRWGDGFRR